MDMKIVGITVAVLVSLTVLAGVLMPVLDDATTTESTFKNTGAFFVEVDPADSYTIAYDNTVANNEITVNGTKITLNRDYTIVALENAILRLNANSHTLDWNGNGQYIANINVLNITISSGSISGSYTTTGSSTSWPTMTYSKCYVISGTEQTLIMSDYSIPVTIKGDSEIVAFGRTVLNDAGTNKQYLVQIEGTINDGVDVTINNVSSGVDIGATITDLSINCTPVDGYNDLYTLNSITFKAAVTDGGATTNVTFSAYIVPSEVTAELTEHFTDNQIALFDAIPIIVIIAILLGVIALVIRSRLD